MAEAALPWGHQIFVTNVLRLTEKICTWTVATEIKDALKRLGVNLLQGVCWSLEGLDSKPG